MEWWHFWVAAVWAVLFWVRRRGYRRQQSLTAVDGRTRSMGERGGF